MHKSEPTLEDIRLQDTKRRIEEARAAAAKETELLEQIAREIKEERAL
jgi:hypothetical protein